MTDKTQEAPSVNSQITDAITQTNVVNIGMAPAHSMATLYQTMAQATGTSLQNSIANQQNVNTVNLAALAQNLQLILRPHHGGGQSVSFSPVVVQPRYHREAASDEGSSGETSKARRSKE